MPIYLQPSQIHRARRNMGVRFLPDGTLEFDTPEEAARYSQLGGGKPSGGRKPARKPRQKAKEPALPYLFPDLVDYKLGSLYRLLSKYVGGQRAYCPSYVKQAQDKGCRLGNVEAFRAMGVTPDLASALLDLFRAQTPDPKSLTSAQKQQNLDYMTSQPGISCKIAKANRGSWGRRRSW
jgi:hypothetical protein